MRKRVKWWWVVATHERGYLKKEECKELGMDDFLEWRAAAKLFTSLIDARSWVRMLKRNNTITEGIQLRVLSDEAWLFALWMYFKGRNYSKQQLS